MAATITLHFGDITTDAEGDAIVDAAGSSLLGATALGGPTAGTPGATSPAPGGYPGL